MFRLGGRFPEKPMLCTRIAENRARREGARVCEASIAWRKTRPTSHTSGLANLPRACQRCRGIVKLVVIDHLVEYRDSQRLFELL
jgi:hypothetical protein